MMPTRKTIGDLTPLDQGRQVVVKGAHAVVIGTLVSFNVESEWVDVTRFGDDPDNPQRVHGARTMTIRIGEWETTGLRLDTPVELDVVPEVSA